MKCVILAGGYGTRLAEETKIIPKPMVEIGNNPILWHIMKIYSTVGINNFIVALGYKSKVIKRYFYDHYHLTGNITLDFSKKKLIMKKNQLEENWIVQLEETGISTMTGGRLGRLKPYLDGEPFCLTYGDGVANVNVKEIIKFHKQHGKLATITAVRPPARFGGITLSNNSIVESFIEKPQIGEGWINGGFFVFESKIFDYINGDNCVLESEVLEELAKEKQLVAFQHKGFWQCMDTLRDKKLLENLWQKKEAPWKVWQ